MHSRAEQDVGWKSLGIFCSTGLQVGIERGQLEGHVLSSGFSHLAANNTAKETLCMIIQGFVLDSNKVSAGSLKIAPHFSEDVCWSFDFSAHFTSQSLSLMATAGLMMTPALLFSQTAAV